MPKIGRRDLLRVIGAASAASALPACSEPFGEDVAPKTSFFTDAERRAIGAFANVIIPPEPGSPGAADLGAASYIERLLTAFDVDPPAIFADGPYSGRTGMPDGRGGEGAHPPNDFSRFVPLDRVSEKAWRIKLYGSRETPDGALNEPIVPAVVGLRDIFKKGIDEAMAVAPAPLETLPLDDVRAAFGALDRDLQDAFIDLVAEAVFGAPEYGGNTNLGGWRLAHFEGDSQPLGYSLFDETTGTYRERPDAPMSTPTTAPDPAPFDDGTRAVLAQVVSFTQGRIFK